MYKSQWVYGKHKQDALYYLCFGWLDKLLSKAESTLSKAYIRSTCTLLQQYFVFEYMLK